MNGGGIRESLASYYDQLFGPITIPWYDELLRQQAAEPSAVPGKEITWPFSKELARFTASRLDSWTLEDAVRGVQVFGAIGSGKTSGSGRMLAHSFLRAGFGGLVLCVKVDEGDNWERYCRETGRSKDLIRIRVDGNHVYNFLDGEATQASGRFATNVAELFTEVMSVSSRGGFARDQFWGDNVRKMLTNAIVLDGAAHGRVTIAGIMDVILSAPKNLAARRKEKASSFPVSDQTDCPAEGVSATQWAVGAAALRNSPDEPEVALAIEYFEKEFAELADKTRSIVVASFTGMADDFRRPALKKLLCGETTCRPEDTFSGKIIVVDLPVHDLRRVGRIANVVWKTIFKNACQRRRSPDRPVFLWADESQYVVDDQDVQFLTTARSTRCCVVYLTQNLSNYLVELGSRERVDALLGSLHMKIYHQNGEQQTNDYAERTIGKVQTEKRSESKPGGAGGAKATVSTSMEWDHDVPARLFTNLRSGGLGNGMLVDGIVHLPGKKWSSGKTWVKVEFEQIAERA